MSRHTLNKNQPATNNLKQKVNPPPFSAVYGTPFEIGDYTNINGPITVKGSRFVRIGKYCDIAENLFIISSNHDVSKMNMQANLQKVFNEQLDVSKGPVYIGNNVWIGDNVTVLTGVSIGDGAVIGAGSVVTKDVPDFCIAAGSPARIIKKRFDSSTIRFLKDLSWWHWDHKTIIKNKEIFLLTLSKNNRQAINEIVDITNDKSMTSIVMKNKRTKFYLLDGWGPLQENYRWVEKQEAGVVFKLASVQKSMQLILCGYSFFKPQKVTLIMNDKKLSTFQLSSWGEYKIRLSNLKTGVNTLRIKFSNGYRPVDIDKLSNDTRVLFGRFTYLRIK